MAAMPDFEAEARAALEAAGGWAGRHFRHQPVPSAPSQSSHPEVPVSPHQQIMHVLADADESVVHFLNMLLAHPEGLAVAEKFGRAAGLPLAPGALSALATAADVVLGVFAPQPAQPPQPAFTPAQDGTGVQAVQPPQGAM